MKPILKFALSGKYYRQIQMALEKGYVLTGKVTFPSTCVVLKKESTDKDLLHITKFEDAAYFMGGGFPKPAMVVSDTMPIRVGKDKDDVIDFLYNKMELGWSVQSVNLVSGSAVLTKVADDSTLCSDIEQLEEIIYHMPGKVNT